MGLRSILLAGTLLITGTVIGATTQHLASAGVSSGERTVLVPIVPCRLADTRPAPNTVGPRSAPLAAADTATIEVQEPTTGCAGEIPADASALSLNVTALGATVQSFITIWSGGDRPLAASLNPAPGEPPVPNAVTTSLSVDQEFKIYNNAGSVNVVIDVNGYYVDHDHDDRYYTETEVDATIAQVESNLTAAIENGHEFAFAFDGSSSVPTYVPSELAVSIEVSTETAGRWIIRSEMGGSIDCAGFAWYYLQVDGVPVPNSVTRRFDSSVEPIIYFGQTAEPIPAGDHEVTLAGECLTGTAGGFGSTSFRSVNVIVVP